MPFTFAEKLQILLDHTGKVRENGIKLGMRMIESGDRETGLKLIANVLVHDNSKFSGFEFDHLWPDDPQLDEALNMHRMRNKHHPQAWGGMKYMPREYIAEMVADCAARSQEQLNVPFRDWASKELTEKWGLSKKSKVYRMFMQYLEMLLEPAFQ